MAFANLTAAQLKLILKTSEGFPTQHEPSKAIDKPEGLSHSRFGHALASHLRGATAISSKTKFADLDNMSRALEAVLRTPTGHAALQRVRPGIREPAFTVEIHAQYLVSAVVDRGRMTVFGPREFAAAGIHRLPCTLILEGRERAGTLHLHIQSFYPRLDSALLARLVAAK